MLKTIIFLILFIGLGLNHNQTLIQSSLLLCPVDSKYTYCKQPRPNEKTCSNIVQIRPPDPLFCGVKQDGTRLNFGRQCQTCKEKTIVYYFDKPCPKAPKVCKTNQICKDTSCIPKDCSNCKPTQICNPTGKCIEKCTFMLCRIGTICKNGKCIKDPNYCISDYDCPNNSSCFGLRCVNAYSSIKCSAGYQCFHGNCHQMKCSGVFCPKGTICKNMKCVPNITVCPIEKQNEVRACLDPRPNEIKCPNLVYIRPQDLLYCGVKVDRSRVGFSRQCQACKDKTIIYYFMTACQNAPDVCFPNQICIGSYCIPK